MKDLTEFEEMAIEIKRTLTQIIGLSRVGRAASDTNALLDLRAGGHEEMYQAIENLAESATEMLAD